MTETVPFAIRNVANGDIWYLATTHKLAPYFFAGLETPDGDDIPLIEIKGWTIAYTDHEPVTMVTDHPLGTVRPDAIAVKGDNTVWFVNESDNRNAGEMSLTVVSDSDHSIRAIQRDFGNNSVLLTDVQLFPPVEPEETTPERVGIVVGTETDLFLPEDGTTAPDKPDETDPR